MSAMFPRMFRGVGGMSAMFSGMIRGIPSKVTGVSGMIAAVPRKPAVFPVTIAGIEPNIPEHQSTEFSHWLRFTNYQLPITIYLLRYDSTEY